MYIASKENPKIKLWNKLSQSKKARVQEGLFVLEGARLCAEAIDQWKNGKLEIYAAFAAEDALEKYCDYIPRELFLDNEYKKFFVVSDEVSRKMSETKGAQGIYIIAHYQNKLLSENDLDKNGRYLILDNLQDPGNVGTILRTADAVGVSGVVMCNNCCELYNPKTIRSAMGSVFRLQIYHEKDLQTVCDLFGKLAVKTYAAVIDKDAVSLTDVDFENGCAVVIGNEGNGLSAEDSSCCDEKITIKMQGNINSLNAAMAGGIILWEMFRNR